MDRKVVAAIAGVCLIAGIAVLASYSMALREASSGDDWTQKIATIEKESPVTYRYDAGGRTHRSGRVTFGDAAVNEARAKALGYKPGQRVLVYVNPADPADAVLELGRRPTGWGQPLAGGLLILVAAALGVYLFVPQQPKAAPPPRKTFPGEATASRKPRNGESTMSRRTGDTSTSRRTPPLSRLKPPAPVKRKGSEDEPTA